MAAPAVIMGVGTVVKMLGQYGANLAQAEQEKANAQFFRMQEDVAREEMIRKERLAAFDYSFKIGEQIGGYAASGIDSGAGSAALTVAGTLANFVEEAQAIRKKGELDMKLASSRARLSENTAKTLESPAYNLTQAATTGLDAYTRSEGFGTWNENRGLEYLYAAGGPGSGTKSTGYGPGSPGSLLQYNYSASDMHSYESYYLGTVGGN